MPVTLTQRYADAVAYVTIAHATQTRKGTNLPYMCHLLGVAGLVLEGGGDEDLAIAGLLHDVAEDQGGEPRLADVCARFGDRVADIVLGCSDSLTENPDDKAPYVQRKTQHIEHLRAAGDDVLLVTAADKLDNARAIHADLLIDGPSMLTRFNGTGAEILWYYDSILKILEAHAAAPRLNRALAHTVGEIRVILENAEWQSKSEGDADTMQHLLHAFELNLEDGDIFDIGLYRSLKDAEAGIAQYILWIISREHAFNFLDGSIALPWGYPTDQEQEDLELDWSRAEAWMQTHSAADLIEWYRKEDPNLELYVLDRHVYDAAPRFDQEAVTSLGEVPFPLENLYLRRSGNMLPPLTP